MNGKAVRHALAGASVVAITVLAKVGPDLGTPWAEIASAVVAAATAYGINKPAPAADDEELL